MKRNNISWSEISRNYPRNRPEVDTLFKKKILTDSSCLFENKPNYSICSNEDHNFSCSKCISESCGWSMDKMKCLPKRV